jgi:hypothetical protein
MALNYNTGNKKLLTDLPLSSYIAIEMDTKCTFGINIKEREFIKLFPETMAAMNPMFVEGRLQPGQLFKFDENGYKVLILINRYARVGILKDDSNSVCQTTQRLIKHVKNIVGDNDVSSWMMIRDTDMWSSISGQLKQMNINWNIYHR